VSDLRERLARVRRLPADTLVGVLIVLVTIFGAYVTWRAAEASGAASDFDQRARQTSILKAQIRGGLRSIVAYERGLFTTYERHLALAEKLELDALDPARKRSRALLQRAADERALARSLQLLFLADQPLTDDLRPAYDAGGALASLFQHERRLRDLQPRRLAKAAESARSKRFWLVAVDTGLIASLFFLTLALLGARLRPRFALAGVVVILVTIVGFVLVQLLVEVPAG
jgi:hypothetical protein